MKNRLLMVTVLSFIIILATGSLMAAPADGGAQQVNWVKLLTQNVTTLWASTLLLTVGFVFLFLEVLTLNGILATLGISSLLVFFLSHIAEGNVPWWIILVFFVGLVLLCIEVFVTPGWGVMGIMGLIFMFASVFVAMGDPNKAAIATLTAMAITGAIFYWALKKLPHSSIWKRLALESTQSSAGGYNAVDTRNDMEGAVGTAVTDLKPGGVALLNDERLDVISRGEYIKKDSPIRVIKIDGMKIVVEPIEGKW